LSAVDNHQREVSPQQDQAVGVQDAAPVSLLQGDRKGSQPPAQPARRGDDDRQLVRNSLKAFATAGVIALTIVAGAVIWSYYVTAPWTRDGRVRVQVASVAPEVSGQVTQLNVVDNQFVHKGDVLYQINSFDFQVAVDQAKQRLAMKAADAQVKKLQAERRRKLDDLATTPEEQERYFGNATQALADFQAAQLEVAQAEINLERTKVRSPVNGYVTNLLMRVGDYAHVGTANMSVIDSDSYWIDGYFEETKLAHICVGDRAEAQLVGYGEPIVGRVETVTRGIGVSDAAAGPQGLPSVDPVYTWVRLAQRVPIRIAITEVPSGVPLVSGLTATVTILGAGDAVTNGGLAARWHDLTARLGEVFHGPKPKAASCLQSPVHRNGPVSTLIAPAIPPRKSLTDIVPDLTAGFSQSKD
jgi:multidrug resistance efflux pump